MNMETEPKNQNSETDRDVNDAAGLMFSGKIKIFDVDTGEILVEQRSE